ncbi:MAG: TlpA disulfide reductase family protein [Fodinibius sp.]|nr:TlpA disulfide reductase family protein [Fodinibius sp.]
MRPTLSVHSMLLLITLFSLLSCGQSDAQQSSKNPSDFKDAPNFSLETRDGNSFTLQEHEGKVVVLNIWATWCSPCRKEIPDFIELYDEMKDQGVLFAGVSVDENGWSDVRPYAKKMEINYPIMVADAAFSRKYGPFRAIPTTFIINKLGKVEYVGAGMLTKEKLKPILEKLAQR